MGSEMCRRDSLRIAEQVLIFENEWRVWEIANLLRRVELCQLPYFQLLSSCSLTFINNRKDGLTVFTELNTGGEE